MTLTATAWCELVFCVPPDPCAAPCSGPVVLLLRHSEKLSRSVPLHEGLPAPCPHAESPASSSAEKLSSSPDRSQRCHTMLYAISSGTELPSADTGASTAAPSHSCICTPTTTRCFRPTAEVAVAARAIEAAASGALSRDGHSSTASVYGQPAITGAHDVTRQQAANPLHSEAQKSDSRPAGDAVNAVAGVRQFPGYSTSDLPSGCDCGPLHLECLS